MTLLQSHPERLPAGLRRLVGLLACLTTACGPGPVAAPEPALVRLTAQAAPYGDAESRRLDLVADLSNPTPHQLRGVFLEVTLVDGPTVTLELGDVPPLGEGSTWHPLRLPRPVGPEAFFGGAAEVVAREDATTLPQLWLVKRFEAVAGGYQVDGEERRFDWTEVANQNLEAWNRTAAAEARRFRARGDEAVAGIGPAEPPKTPSGAPSVPSSSPPTGS